MKRERESDWRKAGIGVAKRGGRDGEGERGEGEDRLRETRGG